MPAVGHELGDIGYVIGVAKNSRMLEFAKPLRASVEEEFTPLGLRPSATRDPNRHSQCSR
jgi:hypothetical protein